jgi:signal transduction histidine kinase
VNYETAPGSLAERLRELGIKSGVGAPVVVDGQLWGALILSSEDDPLPQETEIRLLDFAELVATAISNAANHAALLASRARIVAAGDEARRRIERNLHDGTQQRLIALGLDLQRLRATLAADQEAQHLGLEQVERDLESVLEDVREVSRGLHPALLSRSGLAPALRELARRSPIPVEIEIDLPERPPPSIETAIYYVIAEGLTNATRHSQGTSVVVTVNARNEAGKPSLHASIADDGIGGAEPSEGSGLRGAIDRVDALGGRLGLDSRPNAGTRISVELPLASPR